MADSAERLYGPAALTNTAATVYTVGAGVASILRFVILTNTTSSDHTATVSVGADAAGTRIVDTIPVPAHSVVTIDFFLPLDAGETIQAFADANTSVNLTLSGVESA